MMNEYRMKNLSFRSMVNIIFEIFRILEYRFAKLLVKHPKIALYGGVSLVVAAIVCIFAIQPSPSLSAHPDHENTKYFTTIQVESGDTLWEIADEYMTPEYASIADYMDEVRTINHISEDDITAGCYITIPYYAEIPME
jgi:hypothetical protein